MKYLKKIASLSIALTLLNAPLWSMEREDAETTTGSYRDNLTMFLRCLQAKYPSNFIDSDVKGHIGQFLSTLFIENSLDYNFEKINLLLESTRLPVFSPDSKTFFITFRGIGRLFDTKTKECKALLDHSPDVLIDAAAFSPDSKTLIVGSAKGTVFLYNAQRGELITTLIKYNSCVSLVAFSSCGKIIFTASQDEGTGHLWNAQNKEIITELKGDFYWSSSAAFSPDGTVIAIVSEDGKIRLCDTQTGKVKKEFDPQFSEIKSVAFSSNGKIILIRSTDGEVSFWNVETGNLITKLEHPNRVVSVEFSHDGKTILTVFKNGSVSLWDTEEGTEWVYSSELVHLAQLSPNGKTLLVESKDGSLSLWNNETKSLIRKLQGCPRSIGSVKFSPDGKIVIAKSSDNTLHFWITKPSDETNWILTQANFVQLDLICRAAQAKSSTIITQGTHDYATFMSMPQNVQKYVAQWYSIQLIKSDS